MLRTAVVVDYQNMHHCGHDQYCRVGVPMHLCLFDPGRLARRILEIRASAGRGAAELVDVQVFRGLPEPEYDHAGYERNLAQQRRWETDQVVHVTHRALRYRVTRQCYSIGPGPDVPSTEFEAQEKGIDVLAALAIVDAAGRDDVDLVIVASHDSDLDPAVVAAQRAGGVKVEAVQWFRGRVSSGRLHGDGRLWCTRLSGDDFVDARDHHDYATVAHGRNA